MSDDPLLLMPVDRWCELKSAFKLDWPRSVSGYIALEAGESISKSVRDSDFRVYCPFGDVSNGIVALNIKKTFYQMIIQCPKDDTEELADALKNTKMIDWSRCTEVPFTPKHVMDCVFKVFKEKSCKIHHVSMSETFLLDKNSPPFDIRLSPDLSFELLTEDYVQLVNDKWPHKYPGSDWYFNVLIKSNLGYGLFKGKELLTWVFIKETGSLGHLYTLEGRRRKGYGELTVKLISNELLKDSKYVVAFCLVGNSNAASLYQKLGFQNVNKLIWCTTGAIESI